MLINQAFLFFPSLHLKYRTALPYWSTRLPWTRGWSLLGKLHPWYHCRHEDFAFDPACWLGSSEASWSQIKSWPSPQKSSLVPEGKIKEVSSINPQSRWRRVKNIQWFSKVQDYYRCHYIRRLKFSLAIFGWKNGRSCAQKETIWLRKTYAFK